MQLRISLLTFFSLIVLGLFSCQDGVSTSHQGTADVDLTDWGTVMERARGQEVHMMMWTGDPQINSYMDDYVKPYLLDSLGISLNIASGQGNVIVQSLLAEKQAHKRTSELDLVWINGETFYQLRQIDALFGPWVENLPNAQWLDLTSPFIAQDFQQPIDGYECPWGNVQMCLIYDSARVDAPPMTAEALYEWCRLHPGRFTWDNHFTGLTFLKALLAHMAGGRDALNGPFDEQLYRTASEKLWKYVHELKPYLWNDGASFPANVAQMHRLYADGEVWFTMSNNDCEVDNKILRGVFPASSRAYVPAYGSIQNSHYLGIPALSGNKEAAAVVVNFLISPRAQLRKSDPAVWGDGTVLASSKLHEAWQLQFEQNTGRRYAPSRSSIQERAIQEPDPAYMIRLAEDFRKFQKTQ